MSTTIHTNQATDGRHYFTLVGANGETLCTGVMLPSEASVLVDVIRAKSVNAEFDVAQSKDPAQQWYWKVSYDGRVLGYSETLHSRIYAATACDNARRWFRDARRV